MKKFLVFLLSLTICLTPSLTFAGAAEKWELIENVYDKSKNVVKLEARKIAQTAANSARYRVEVPVNPVTLGSSVKSMLGIGLAVSAITALVEGVGWIIDEGSKVIMKPVIRDPQLPDQPYVWMWDGGLTFGKFIAPESTYSDQLCGMVLSRVSNKDPWKYDTVVVTAKSPQQVSCYISSSKSSFNGTETVRKSQNPNYNPGQKIDYVPVTDTELGNEVLGKGTEPNSSKAPADEIITQAYNPNNETDAGAESDSALDASPPNPDSNPTGETKPKPNVDTDGDGKDDAYDPNKPSKGDQFELPKFCDWAVTVCTWYTKYKEDSNKTDQHRQTEKSFWQETKDWFNWTKKEPEKDNSDNDVPIQTPTPFDNSVFSKDRFAVSRQCPIPEQHTISLSGVSVNFSFDMTPLCQVLILARPALVACSYLYAAYIVIGAARNG